MDLIIKHEKESIHARRFQCQFKEPTHMDPNVVYLNRKYIFFNDKDFIICLFVSLFI